MKTAEEYVLEMPDDVIQKSCNNKTGFRYAFLYSDNSLSEKI